MADDGRKRLISRRSLIQGAGEMGRSTKERKSKKPKERWLLTRKTWRYMADAGRKLIPDGALNRPEDVPKIEAYFQEVCQKESRFLLWRKSSYPGALGFRSHRSRRHRKGGSYRTKSNSADECEDAGRNTSQYYVAHHTSGGRFDINKMKHDFLNKPLPASSSTHSFPVGGPRSTLKNLDLPTTREEDSDETQLVEMLGNLLKIEEGHQSSISRVDDKGGTFDYQALVDKLQQHLNNIYRSTRMSSKDCETVVSKSSSSSRSRYISGSSTGNVRFEGDIVQKSLQETLSRYFSKSPNREHVISDLLTNRKLLEKLYFELRQTKGFRNTRGLGNYSSTNWRPLLHHRDNDEEYDSYEENNDLGSWKRLGKSKSILSQKTYEPPMSPPPLIEIQQDSTEIIPVNCCIQTDSLPEHILQELEDEYRKQNEVPRKTSAKQGTSRRKSSIDHDDVSQSVSDTIKRYLRMARKKSVEADKVDRFKRVNYDKNLRFIKAKGEITKPGDDDGLNKGCQTNDDWITIYRDLKFDDLHISESTSPISGDDYMFGSRVNSSRSSFETTVGDDPLYLTTYMISQNTPPNIGTPKSSPSSPPSPTTSGIIASGQSFLSNLLHGSRHHSDKTVAQQIISSPVTAGAAVAMQKSKSSSSVGSRLVAKKIWRSRSKSQTRATTGAISTWTPQGQCTWTNVTGRQVTLQDTSLLQLSEIERRILQKVALAKLQALNLGVSIRIPSETSEVAVTKPKRRAYLLKRKALTTSFFDNTRNDKDKGGTSSASGSCSGQSNTGLVFGIPLNQCIENDRLARIAHGGSPFRNSRSELSGSSDTAVSIPTTDTNALRRQSHHGSRTSFSSLIDTTTRHEDNGSCDSLISRDRIGASVPGLLDTLSSSTSDLAVTSEDEPNVPQMVTACLRYLEQHGLHTLGIFRVSSSKKRVRQLREEFDSGKEIMIDDEQCPHDIATLLKEYLRDLPDPLLCRDLYYAFVQTQKIRNRRLQFEAIQYLVHLLPTQNRDTLYALLHFLAVVAMHSNDQTSPTGECILGNKMDSGNLATVFAPNILHCIKVSSSGKESNERAEDRMDVINVIRSMIDHHRQLFVVSAELIDEVYTIMMDTNPTALDALLSKKDSINIGDELTDDLIDSETSTPKSPSAPIGIENVGDSVILAMQARESDETSTIRRVWSREEFLHGIGGTGGPNLAMRVRHKDRDRGRDRLSKKRWRDESITRKQTGSDDSNINNLTKSRSSSMDSGNIPGDSSIDSGGRVLKITEEQRFSTQLDSRRQSTPLLDSANVITASLKIPLQSSSSGPLSLNLDDPDIPFIEDHSYSVTLDGKQQMPIGILRNTPIVPPRRRQSSMSGSDSSQGSIQPVTGSLSIGQQASYDSAVGSSTTFSSPPRNTPSSVSSSVAGDNVFSSPPSWASTPPTSPDSSHTAVNYIPDETEHFNRVRQRVSQKTTDLSTAILQKVTFTSASELQQKPKHVDVHGHKKDVKTSTSEVTKSASTSQMTPKDVKHEKFSPSISSIGGAVLRSRTADFERMMSPVKKSDTSLSKPKTDVSATAAQLADKKKYVKRRYTDSRHQTRHIPDSESLVTASSALNEKANIEKSDSAKQSIQVYKRREIIASVPKEKRSFF